MSPDGCYSLSRISSCVPSDWAASRASKRCTHATRGLGERILTRRDCSALLILPTGAVRVEPRCSTLLRCIGSLPGVRLPLPTHRQRRRRARCRQLATASRTFSPVTHRAPRTEQAPPARRRRERPGGRGADDDRRGRQLLVRGGSAARRARSTLRYQPCDCGCGGLSDSVESLPSGKLPPGR